MFVYVERIENIFYTCLVDTEECIVKYVAKIVFFSTWSFEREKHLCFVKHLVFIA